MYKGTPVLGRWMNAGYLAEPKGEERQNLLGEAVVYRTFWRDCLTRIRRESIC